jgi:hypothetical protein
MTEMRNRSRASGSLQQRLKQMARIARQKAEALPAGDERDRLLRKADQSERSAAMEDGSPHRACRCRKVPVRGFLKSSHFLGLLRADR